MSELLGIKSHMDDEVENINWSGRHIDHKAYYDIILHTEEDDFEITKMLSVDVIRDYVNNNGDVIIATFEMPLGDFVKHVYPFKENLYITLINRVISVKTIRTYKFRFTEIEEEISNGTYNRTDIKTLNARAYTRLSGQCVDLTVDQMQTKAVYGSHREATPGDVLSTHLTQVLDMTQKFDEIVAKNVVMRDPHNTRTYQHIIVPTDKSIFELPDHIQKGDYGIYDGDIGTYLQPLKDKEELHVFPKYNPIIEAGATRILKVFALRKKLPPSTKNTYTMDDEYLNIVVALDNVPFDVGNTVNLNEGVTLEGIETDTLMRRSHQTTPVKVKSSDKWMMRKQRHKDMPDRTYKHRYIGSTNNWYHERSKVLKNDGRTIVVNWVLSNIYYLRPCMPVEFYIEDTIGDLYMYEGSLHGVHGVTDKETDTENATLSIFLKNTDKAKKLT